MGSENTREKIAKAYGYEYEEFLALGGKLTAGETPAQPPPEKTPAPEPDVDIEADETPPSKTELKLLNTIKKLAIELKEIREELSEIRKNTNGLGKEKPDPGKDQKAANSAK